MAKVGRPQKYSEHQIQEIAEDFAAYIEENIDPTIVRFTANYKKYSINKDYINNHDEFTELRKRAIEKQESYLLSSITTKSGLNPTIAIFRLKQPQHGYSDKQEIDQTLKGEIKTDRNPELAKKFEEFLKSGTA